MGDHRKSSKECKSRLFFLKLHKQQNIISTFEIRTFSAFEITTEQQNIIRTFFLSCQQQKTTFITITGTIATRADKRQLAHNGNEIVMLHNILPFEGVFKDIIFHIQAINEVNFEVF